MFVVPDAIRLFLVHFGCTGRIGKTGMHVYMITGVVVSTDMEMVNDLFHRIMKKGGGH